MANLTIKKIDRRILERLSLQAKKRGRSLNAYVKDALARVAGLEPGLKTYTDLSHLAGTWTPEEENEFLASIQPLSAIDAEMWK
jgi:hypothetical protein